MHEPPHVHIRKDRQELKVWLEPISVAYNRRVNAKTERELLQVVAENCKELIDGWHRHFG
ncbi:MAG: DUF4160 domain-containing protein [Pseudomonadota bacterium]